MVVPLLVGVKDGMELALPLAGNPVTPFGELPLQVKVVPPTDEVKFTTVVAAPEHTVCTSGVFVMTGTGLTVTVTAAVAEQLVTVLFPVTV